MQITAFANTPYASLTAWGGTSLAQGALGKSAARSTASEDNGLVVDASFAQDMLRRLTTQAQAGTDGQAKDATGLVNALKDSMDYLRGNFGDQAATAAIGLVYQSVGDNPLTEDNLGRGLVNALKFVDRNFGAAAGDQAISYFNGALNEQLNAYFDNGANERFLAVDSGMSGVLQQVQGALADLGDSLGQGVADALGKILENSLGDKVDANSLRGAVSDIRTWLEENYGPDAAASADTLLGSALGGQVPAQKGLLLDLAA
jgi:hypothetical protein